MGQGFRGRYGRSRSESDGCGMCWKAASSIWYWKRVSLFSATGPSGATPSSGGICASAVVAIVMADDEVTALLLPDADVGDTNDVGTPAEEDVGGARGNPEDETIEVAFTVEVVLLPALPAGREPPLPMPAVDAAKRDRVVLVKSSHRISIEMQLTCKGEPRRKPYDLVVSQIPRNRNS